MRVFHICCNYSTTSLYKNIVALINKKNLNQTIYVPVRKSEHLNKNKINDNEKIRFVYSLILRPWHRILYYTKLKTVFNDIINSSIEVSEHDVIHAHTLFSDGGVAYHIYRKFGIPYIVAVRNTDINIYYKYMTHLKSFSYKILMNASCIVFINHNYKNKLIEDCPNNVKLAIQKKSVIIPNGLDDFWISHPITRKKPSNTIIKLLFVGNIVKNKNIAGLIKIIRKLNENIVKAELTIIGRSKRDKYSKKIGYQSLHLGNIYIKDKIEDPILLRDFYRNSHIYIMISFSETFGLTYLEALSQGMPIIYTRGEGIDGFFEEGEVGYAVSPHNSDEIIKAIYRIGENYDEISKRCVKAAQSFGWNEIVDKYISIYNNTK